MIIIYIILWYTMCIKLCILYYVYIYIYYMIYIYIHIIWYIIYIYHMYPIFSPSAESHLPRLQSTQHRPERRWRTPDAMGEIPGKHGDSTNIGSTYLVCGFNHLEKYESQWEGLSNHQPDIVSTVFSDAIACLHGFKISKGWKDTV